MAKIRIVGDSSGYVELSAPNAAGNNTLELPSNATKLVGADANNNLSVSGITTFSSGIVVSSGSAAAPSISPFGDSNTGIFFPAADTVAIGEGGTEVLRVDSSGRIGIGTTNPGIAYAAQVTDKVQIAGGTVRINPGQKANSNFPLTLSTMESSNNMELIFRQERTSYHSIQSVHQGNAYTPLSLQPNGGNLGIGITNPECAFVVSTGNIRMASGYSRMVSGFKSANASSFTMFDIVGIFREDLTELIIKHGHEGGGVHGSYRRWIFTSNASNSITTFEDTGNINYGGGNGFSFSWPSYGTLRITWGGASAFSEAFQMCCWIRCRNNITFTNQGMDSLSV